jgi:hypothetical protein
LAVVVLGVLLVVVLERLVALLFWEQFHHLVVQHQKQLVETLVVLVLVHQDQALHILAAQETRVATAQLKDLRVATTQATALQASTQRVVAVVQAQ